LVPALLVIGHVSYPTNLPRWELPHVDGPPWGSFLVLRRLAVVD